MRFCYEWSLSSYESDYPRIMMFESLIPSQFFSICYCNRPWLTLEPCYTVSMKSIGIIVGSNRPGRICLDVASWVQTLMQNDKLHLDLIDLAEINLPFLDEPEIPAHHKYQKEHSKNWSQQISRYDGFVLVFPQYNWGYPAVLKNALDYLYDEWANKPVSVICYGNHGGFQAAMAMKLVTQGLHMSPMSTNPPLNIEDEMFDERGQFKDIDNALARYKNSIRAVSAEFVDLLAQPGKVKSLI
jgi:NAD(P)H-dependent FMN reductase